VFHDGFVPLKKILQLVDTGHGHGHVIFLSNLVEKVAPKKMDFTAIMPFGANWLFMCGGGLGENLFAPTEEASA
jgi:hypothetical protein